MAPKPALGKALYEAGWIVLWQGDDPDKAIALLEEALTLFRELGDRRGVAISITYLGQRFYTGATWSARRY